MSAPLQIHQTTLSDVRLVRRLPIADSRGFLERMFCADTLQPLLAGRRVVQINRTLTAKRGTVRGMHLQHAPHAEMKLVSCLRGAVFDVAVDLRHGSPTLLQWHAEVLSADNHLTMVIPEGVAHGLQTLSDDCELLYLHTAPYCREAEGGFNACDPSFAIAWPQPIAEQSERDRAHPMLAADFAGLTL